MWLGIRNCLSTRDLPKGGKLSRGSSLLELIIYIGVTIMVVAVMTELVVVMLRVREHDLAEREVQQNLRFVVSRLERALTQATAVTGVYPSDTLTLTIGGDTTTFQVASGVLQMKEGVAGSFVDVTTSKVTVCTTDCDSLFTKVSNSSPAKDSVQLKIKIEYATGGKATLTASASAQTTIELRQI